MFKKSKTKAKSLDKGASFWSIGASIFAMFFGAGNIIFPLQLGLKNFVHPSIASTGFIITAVLVPCLGLIAIVLYSGDYKKFFFTIGKIPGFILITLILGLIGPFAGIPRAIIVSHGTLSGLQIPSYFLGGNLTVFSAISCILIFIFSSRLGKLIQWLGFFFSPVMLITLAVIIIKALMLPSHTLIPNTDTVSSWFSFKDGFVSGFHTMDLLASFFFSSIVLLSLRKIANPENNLAELENNPHAISKKATALLLKGSLLASFLLAVVYFFFILIASLHSADLNNINITSILGHLSTITLGKQVNWITGLCVFFACLSTEIALTGIFAEFLQAVLFPNQLKYSTALLITVVTTFCMSILDFNGIVIFLAPVLKICYPALIVLTVINILKKLVSLRYVKIYFYGMLFLTFVFKYYIN